MKPDLVWYRHGQPQAVIDAKYKAERTDGFPKADLYQMLAYCTVLGLHEGHLVYAKSSESMSSLSIRRADVLIRCHALDLELQPVQLLTQVDELAQMVRGPLGVAR